MRKQQSTASRLNDWHQATRFKATRHHNSNIVVHPNTEAYHDHQLHHLPYRPRPAGFLFVISGIFKIVGFAGTVGYFTAWACRSRPWPCWSPSWSKSAAACCS
jgi:hypothetical protein